MTSDHRVDADLRRPFFFCFIYKRAHSALRLIPPTPAPLRFSVGGDLHVVRGKSFAPHHLLELKKLYTSSRLIQPQPPARSRPTQPQQPAVTSAQQQSLAVLGANPPGPVRRPANHGGPVP